MSRVISALRIILPVLATAFLDSWLSELAGKPTDPLPNPLELRAKNHVLSLTLHAAITPDDKSSFYFNGQPSAPTLRVSTGENDKPIANPVWLDTVNVPYGGTVDVIMDFTDPVIRGMSAFHCHLLNHEDKGMMAKVLFE
jgi:hypothetical protein